MDKLLNGESGKLYLYLIAMLIVSVGWKIGESINQRFSEMEIKQAPRIDRSASILDAKSFYPVWVKQLVANPQPGPEQEVDTLFNRREEKPVEPPKPAEPDYGELFKQQARIDGISETGAFINGTFYRTGERLDDFAYTSPDGRRIIAVLKSTEGGRLRFQIGAQTLSFIYGDTTKR